MVTWKGLRRFFSQVRQQAGWVLQLTNGVQRRTERDARKTICAPASQPLPHASASVLSRAGSVMKLSASEGLENNESCAHVSLLSGKTSFLGCQ
jgi:hypothetical protein